MKQCPTCKTTYSDDTLNFCLVDGAALISLSGAEKTVEMSGETTQMHVNTPESLPTVVSPARAPAQTVRQGINPWLVFPLLAVLFFAVAGLLGYILFRPLEETGNNKTASTPTATATPDSETAALKEELESLKKEIEEQKSQKNNSPAQPFPTQSQPVPTTQVARVHSPNDGFLALRSQPNSKTGERLAKIPHGTNIEIIGCQKFSTQISNRRGRWCRTAYDGQSGWVFDAWLLY